MVVEERREREAAERRVSETGVCLETVVRRSVGPYLEEVSHVHGHLLDGGVVKLLNVVQRASVVLRHKVDGHAFTTKSSTTTNSAQ